MACRRARPRVPFMRAECHSMRPNGSRTAASVWQALAVNSPSNHAAFVDGGAIEVLCGILTSAISYPGLDVPARAVMWAAMALQALCTTYCDTPDGRCPWRWEQGTALAAGAALGVDAAEARSRALAQPLLVRSLGAYVCTGPVDGSGEPPWPSSASLASRLEPSIIPWAAASALGSLALSAEGRDAIERDSAGLTQCLCRLLRSPDALERAESLEVLHRLGMAPSRHGAGSSACA